METVTKLRKLRDIRPNLQKGLIFHAPLDENSVQLGPELIVNGRFDGNANGWTLYDGWTYGDHKINVDSSAYNRMVNSGSVVVGRTYKCTFTISNYVSGDVGWQLGASAAGTQNSNGTFSAYIVAVSAQIDVVSFPSFVGSIDNVSVKEVKAGVIDRVSGAIGTPTDVYNVPSEGDITPYMSYDGVNDYTALPTLPAFGTGDFTVVAKVKPNSFLNNMVVVSGQDNSFSLYVRSDGKLECNKVSVGSVSSPSSALITVNTEAIVSYIRVGTVGTYYINGVASGTCTDNFDYTVPNSFVGIYVGGSYPFNGSISLCRIFNYALTSDDIAYYSKPENPIKWIDRGATGVNLVANGGFDGNANGWNLGSGWTYGSNNISGDISSTANINQNIGMVAGRYYRLIFTTSQNEYGLIPLFGGQTSVGNGTQVFASGTYTQNHISDGASIYLRAESGYIGSIDNVSVTQLGCLLDLNAEGMGTDWVDKTNSLTATNSGAVMVTPPSSNLGAMAFNGSSSNVLFSGNLNLVTDQTISVWVYARTQSISDIGFVFFFGETYLRYNSTNAMYFTRGLDPAITTSAVLTLNRWHHIVITSKGSLTTIYIDGVRDGSTNIGSPITASANSIGTYLGSYCWDGMIKNMQIWKRVLSSEEIKLLNEA